MERRKNSNLHVVREPEDPTDKIIDEIMETEKDDGWYCDRGCSGRVDISADQSTDIYQGPDQ